MEGYLGEFEPTKGHEFEGYGYKDWILEYLARYSWIDGAHHKIWLLDQVARIALGTPIIVTEARWANGHKELRFTTGDPSPAYLEWRGKDFDEDDEGIAP